MFWTSTVPIIRSYQLYTWQLVCFMHVIWPLPTRVRFQRDSPRQRPHNPHETYQLPRVQLITPDDGHSRYPKYVEFRDKIKFWILDVSCWLFIRRWHTKFLLRQHNDYTRDEQQWNFLPIAHYSLRYHGTPRPTKPPGGTARYSEVTAAWSWSSIWFVIVSHTSFHGYDKISWVSTREKMDIWFIDDMMTAVRKTGTRFCLLSVPDRW
jgi:hypothetical protein